MEYNFRDIERKWQEKWKADKVYKVENGGDKPKCYVLDMFPYPSGAGLHVGHPLGYIASDIYARYKRLKGFNVLHPMGFDSFGLPAEQYALETGQHPAATTEKNIATFKAQLDKIGFCYDWDREVRTSDPSYYKWTQWIFLKLYNSYFCNTQQKARPISDLIEKYETKGCKHFTAEEWKAFSEKEKSDWLMKRRLAFVAYGEVNWCEALGTVLANDEVVNGVSERGGHPVEKKKMRQWYLRITAYADRLLQGLETVDFSDAMKEMQRNWIGKSEGAEITFQIESEQSSAENLTVYTTRPDTIFGVDFMVIAPELDLVNDIVSTAQKPAIEKYLTYVKSRSDRERMAEVKQVTGEFTGAYAINPFDGRKIPIYIAEYVLAGYGTGAIMAVPCGDQRDYLFAKHFDIPITNIIGDFFNGEEANPTKEATLQNSGFLNGLKMSDAIGVAIDKIEEMSIGKRKKNYKMRDAGFSRQRYWGEPFPIVWEGDIPHDLPETDLPLELPHVDKYGPGPDGEGPLANIKEWIDLTPALSPETSSGQAGAGEDLTPNPSGGADENLTPALSYGEGEYLTPNPSPKERGTEPHNYQAGFVNSTSEQWKNTIAYAKQNRKDATKAEDMLWQRIRNRQVDGAKFRRQYPMHGYIPDFVCLDKQLIIEIDGGYHNEQEQKEFDEARENYLHEYGLNFLRFTNDEVEENIDLVIETITQKLRVLTSVSGSLDSNSPLPWRGVGGEVNLRRESSTMPGYAGSSWYFLRYMDPHNAKAFCDRSASDYWNQVDVYVGGTEHAVGHLLYSRMWTKVLYDLGYIGYDEPFKKLVNQGMIQGSSRFVHRIEGTNQFVSAGKKDEFKTQPIHVDVNIVDGYQLDIEAFKKFKPDFADAEFIFEDGSFSLSCGVGDQPKEFLTTGEVEKMSKSKYNTVNPDDLVAKYGADTFRMYEMFLGPVEQSKPWDTKGIEGVHRFLRKLWRLFNDDVNGPIWTSASAPSPSERAGGEVGEGSGERLGGAPTDADLKILHTAIRKIDQATNDFSYNTAVSAFMVCVNELHDAKCYKKEILEQLLILLTPYAPHIAEELWHQLGNEGTILNAPYPKFEEKYVLESTKEYPVSINGKLRTNVLLHADVEQADAEKAVLQNEVVQKWLDGNPPKRIIFVKNKMVNVVV